MMVADYKQNDSYNYVGYYRSNRAKKMRIPIYIYIYIYIYSYVAKSSLICLFSRPVAS